MALAGAAVIMVTACVYEPAPYAPAPAYYPAYPAYGYAPAPAYYGPTVAVGVGGGGWRHWR